MVRFFFKYSSSLVFSGHFDRATSSILISFKKGTRTQLVYLKSIETNYTIFLNLTTPSTTTILTTTISSTMATTNSTPKSPGLVGDLCSKVFGDCEKFMECKKIGIHWNISHCQCIAGYQTDEHRHCSWYLVSSK